MKICAFPQPSSISNLEHFGCLLRGAIWLSSAITGHWDCEHCSCFQEASLVSAQATQHSQASPQYSPLASFLASLLLFLLAPLCTPSHSSELIVQLILPQPKYSFRALPLGPGFSSRQCVEEIIWRGLFNLSPSRCRVNYPGRLQDTGHFNFSLLCYGLVCLV